MFRTAHTLGCIVVFSAAVVLATPGLSQAQRGGHGGGGHFGGGYRGGAHVGGYHGGMYRGAGYYGGYRSGYGYPYAGYGYGPYYGSYDYSPNFDEVSPYFSEYSSPYETVPQYSHGLYPPPTVIPSDTSAHVTVTVPAGAEIWFDDSATTSTGTIRQFNSPPLTPGNHSYEVRARWNENGHEATQSQRVEVTPGAQVNVSFPLPSAAPEPTAKKD